MRPFTWVLVGILSILIILLSAACILFSAPKYHGKPSDHFDGKRFFNLSSQGEKDVFRFLKWMWTRKPGEWLQWRDTQFHPAPPQRVGVGEINVTFVGHSTVLIQIDGVNILTDPVWSMHIGPVENLGPKRHRPPGIDFEKLPPIDLVLVSHNHYDHLDLPTVKDLMKSHSPKFLTGLGNKEILVRNGANNSEELDWWDKRTFGDLQITFVPAVHFSSRSPCDRNRTLWGGFVIEGKNGAVYFAGDTGMGKQFEEIKNKFGNIKLAILPIGAYLPRWFMAKNHLSPEEAVSVYKTIGAKKGMAIHFGTFRLGDDGEFDAVNDLISSLDKEKISLTDFWVLDPGQHRRVQ